MITTCEHVRAQFSDYLDQALTGREMIQLSSHMNECGECAREFSEWRAMQRSLSAIGTAKAPANLGLKLRLAISREKVKNAITWKDRLELAWANSVRPIALKTAAGLASTVVIVGGVLGLLTAVTPSAQSVLADDDLGAYTEPHYKYSAVNMEGVPLADFDTPLIVEALLNARGQIYDYNIVSGSVTPELRRDLEQRMLVSVYEPAKVFGTPVKSRIFLTFAGISVRG